MLKTIILSVAALFVLYRLFTFFSKKAVLKRKMVAAYITEHQFSDKKTSAQKALTAWDKATRAAWRAGNEIAAIEAKFGLWRVHSQINSHYATSELAPSLIESLLEASRKDEPLIDWENSIATQTRPQWHTFQLLLVLLNSLAQYPKTVREENLTRWRIEAIAIYEALLAEEFCPDEESFPDNFINQMIASVGISDSHCKPASLYIPHVHYLLQSGEKEATMKLVAELHQSYGGSPADDANAPLASLSDILASVEYQQWLSAQHQQRLANLSDKEKAQLQKAAHIQQNLHSQRPLTKQDELIPRQELAGAYNVRARFNTQAFNVLNEIHSILVLHGDTHINGNLDADWLKAKFPETAAMENQLAVLVAGNLRVDGDVVDDKLLLEVLGDMSCQCLYFSQGCISVQGQLHASCGICFDAIGIKPNFEKLILKSKIKTPYILNNYSDCFAYDASDYPPDFIDAENSMALACIYQRSKTDTFLLMPLKEVSLFDGTPLMFSEPMPDSWPLLNPEVWDEREQFSPARFFQLVRAGKNPFIELP